MKNLRLSNEEISSLTLALYHLTHSGIATGDAFAMMAEDEPKGRYKELLQTLSRGADEGKSLGALFQESGCFPDHVCSLLTVGEKVGNTEETLFSLAKYYENRANMEAKLKNSLMYPMTLMLVMVVVIAALLMFVMPVFSDVYASLGSSLTGVAGALLAVGNGLRKSLPLLCLIMLAAVVFALALVGCAAFREKLMDAYRTSRGDRGLWAGMNNAFFAQALSMGLESGLTELEAVSLAAHVSQGCSGFESRCRMCSESLEKGEGLADALRESALLSRKDSRLLEAGLRSGSGERVMSEIAENLSRESQQALERSMMKIEPAMVLIMSLLVGCILLSVMLPLMNIMNAIG